ncbi:hypothetical protein KFK09_008624 [Dendrobium nobile]|uniref:Uncharacterized protein n=1 Tax=Dendrobium nobile TaxID=94219 RepID=A0A8T3BRD4_DENNO|nr:hypothetical protein KFK09_008624 [Dendrobium nobile]
MPQGFIQPWRAYDGEKTLFTIVPLSQVNNEFTVILDHMPSKRNGNRGGNA